MGEQTQAIISFNHTYRSVYQEYFQGNQHLSHQKRKKWFGFINFLLTCTVDTRVLKYSSFHTCLFPDSLIAAVVESILPLNK